MVLGKRKSGLQGGRDTTGSERARGIIESLHRIEVWDRLKELEFYIHLSSHTDLNREERDAIADCLECKFAQGDFDGLQRDFMAKLTHLERVVRGRYDHIVDFLRPTRAPSLIETTNYALRSLDATNVKCLNDLLIYHNPARVIRVRDSIVSAFKKDKTLTFEQIRNATLDIQEFVSYLFPWRRQLLYLHLLTSKHKPHPAEVAWTQDALMSPGIAQAVRDRMNDRRSTNTSPALQKLGTTINLIIHQVTYRQPGLMAASLRADAAELDKQEMDLLIGQIREAQELMRGQDQGN
ncbi:hypothetical protein TruAng_008154 [Truncatella angustata]|nr:hypothetical protein TruAng_008154 [Truncatella angustata]